MKTSQRQGFTIVELIVVIAVIAILAGVVIFSYGQWRKQVLSQTIKSDLTTALSTLENARNFSESGYPEQLPATIAASEGVILSGGGRPGGVFFCVEAASTQDTSLQYYVSNKQKDPKEGTCSVTSTQVVSGGATVDMWGASSAGVGRSGGITVDDEGFVYLANGSGGSKNAILRANPSTGAIAAFAGSGVSGGTNGAPSAAQFRGPNGIVWDSARQKFFVSDVNNNSVRVIDAAGNVSTLAGVHQANAIAQDPSGLLYVPSGNSALCDTVNTSNGHKIRTVTQSGVVTILAGSGICGTVDGPPDTAQFNNPSDIAVDSTAAYVTQTGCRIRKISLSGYVSTLTGTDACQTTTTDGTLAAATFREPGGLALDSRGNLYVADYNKIRVITVDGRVETLVTATFSRPMSLAFDNDDNLWVTDLSANLTKITIP